jgi:hypothetical protein
VLTKVVGVIGRMILTLLSLAFTGLVMLLSLVAWMSGEPPF